MNKFLAIMLCMSALCGCSVDHSERINAGNNHYDQAQYDQAVEAYQAAQVSAPDNAEAYYNAGGAFSRSGEPERAIFAFKQALKTSDVDLTVRIWFNMGNLYFEVKRYGEAVNAYQQVLLLRPGDGDARHNLELTLNVLSAVSPTPEPTDSTSQNEPTPTADAGFNHLPTPLPSLAEGTSTSDILNPQPQDSASTLDASNLAPTFSVEDAEQLLDAIQQAQQPFPSLMDGTPSSATSGKDW